MPREQKRSAKILSGNETSTCDDVCDVKTFYRRIFFNVIDTVVNCIEDRFARPGYLSSRNIEQLLLNVACRLDYESQLSDVVGCLQWWGKTLSVINTLTILETNFNESDRKTFTGIINYTKQYSGVEREFFSEISILLRLYLVFPAISALSERSASTMRHQKLDPQHDDTGTVKPRHASFSTQRKHT